MTAREQRLLEVSVPDDLPETPLLIDDLAVSGLTLSLAARALPKTPEILAVGMQFDSRRTRKRMDVTDVRTGFTYRSPVGNPPINSVQALRTIPERLEALAERYFSNSPAMKQLLLGEEL
jgi:hypothetical protein